jgi:mRNA interferase RelE/StbE
MHTSWKLKETQNFKEALLKLQAAYRQRIRAKLNRLVELPDPRMGCKALTGGLSGLRSLRVGNYRVILRVDEPVLEVVALDVGHRREVYD